jgi:histidinol-phosphate aminotransferase
MKEKDRTITSRFKPYFSIKGGYKGGKRVTATAKGQKTYKLSSNENPIGPSPRVVATIRGNLSELCLYPDPTDIRLRQALAAYYGHQLQPDQLVCANGGSELIEMIIRGFVNPGDEVIISAPYFVPYRTFSLRAGARVVNVPLLEPVYEVDVEGIRKAIGEKTRIVFLTSPNNPTGTYIPQRTLEALLATIPPDVLVVLDEVYWHFTTAADYTRALPYLERYSNLIAVNSLSKTFGLAALRLGYAYMNLEVANYLRQLCRPFMISRLSLEGAIAALQDHEFVQRTVELVIRERAFMEAEYTALGIAYTPSQANFILVDPPVAAAEFVDFLFGQGIAVRPMDNFGAPGRVRISIGHREANRALLAAIQQLLNTELD